MFSKPEAGWIDINIGNYEISASYLTDIPMDFLNSLINSLENNLPFSVFIDEEETDEFLRLCMTYLENKGYEVYVGNTRYSYNNATQNVQPNELMIAFKNEK